MKLNPKQIIKIDKIETEAWKYLGNMIDQLHKVGFIVGGDYKKIERKFNGWLQSYGMKRQPLDKLGKTGKK